jgi:hypothetical protein
MDLDLDDLSNDQLLAEMEAIDAEMRKVTEALAVAEDPNGAASPEDAGGDAMEEEAHEEFITRDLLSDENILFQD